MQFKFKQNLIEVGHLKWGCFSSWVKTVKAQFPMNMDIRFKYYGGVHYFYLLLLYPPLLDIDIEKLFIKQIRKNTTIYQNTMLSDLKVRLQISEKEHQIMNEVDYNLIVS